MNTYELFIKKKSFIEQKKQWIVNKKYHIAIKTPIKKSLHYTQIKTMNIYNPGVPHTGHSAGGKLA